MKIKKITFQPLTTNAVFSDFTENALSEMLDIPLATITTWRGFVPPLWSQYIRESEFGNYPVVRRRMAKQDALTVFITFPRMAKHFGSFKQLSKSRYLPELESLQLEYATRGKVKGKPLFSDVTNMTHINYHLLS